MRRLGRGALLSHYSPSPVLGYGGGTARWGLPCYFEGTEGNAGIPSGARPRVAYEVGAGGGAEVCLKEPGQWSILRSYFQQKETRNEKMY